VSKNVVIDGVEYAPLTSPSEWRIVVLHRGNIVVGRYSREGSEVIVRDAAVIRRWGTTRGLGELAAEGPLANTVLDPCGIVRAHELAVVLTIDCEADKWTS